PADGHGVLSLERRAISLSTGRRLAAFLHEHRDASARFVEHVHSLGVQRDGLLARSGVFAVYAQSAAPRVDARSVQGLLGRTSHAVLGRDKSLALGSAPPLS